MTLSTSFHRNLNTNWFNSLMTSLGIVNKDKGFHYCYLPIQRDLADQIFASSLTLSNLSINFFSFFREVIFDHGSKTPLGL